MALIQNILSNDIEVIPQGSGTVILRLPKSTSTALTKAEVAAMIAAAIKAIPGSSSSSSSTIVSGSSADETLLWLAQ